MLFGFSLLILFYSCFITGIRLLMKAKKLDAQGPRLSLGPLLVISAIAVAMPMLVQFFNALRFSAGESVSLNQGMAWQLLVMSAGCIFAIIYFGLDLRAMAQAQQNGFLKIGRAALSILCATFMIFAVADHFYFFSHSANAGVADLESMSMFGPGVKDIDCPAGRVLVADYTAKAVLYRCPRTLIWGSDFTSTPFVPWGSYQEGESEQLGTALRNMVSKAQK